MSANTLATELESMVPVDNEQDAIDNFSTAFENYFSESSCGAPVSGSLSAAVSAMKTSLAGMSASGQATAKIQAGIVAFWGIVATSAPTIWVPSPPLASATPPPGLSGISASLDSVVVSNVENKLSLSDCALAIATVIHSANLGGFGINTAVPTPVSVPIL